MVGGCDHDKIKSHTCWVGNPQLENHNTKKFSHCCKVLGSTSGFPAWGLNKWTGNLQGIWLGSPEDLIAELPQAWGKQAPLLEGTNKTLCMPGPGRKEQWPHRRPQSLLTPGLGPSEDNWITVFLSTALSTRARFSFPHCQSLPLGSLHKPLILIWTTSEFCFGICT